MNKDLPVAIVNWTERLIQRHTVRNSLVEEIKDKSNPILEVCSSVLFFNCISFSVLEDTLPSNDRLFSLVLRYNISNFNLSFSKRIM